MLAVTNAASHRRLCAVSEAMLFAKASATDSALVSRLVDQASARVESYTRRVFAQQTYEESLPSEGGPRLLLSRTPVTSLDSVHYKDTDYTDDVTLEDAAAGIVYKEDLFRTTALYRGYLLYEPQNTGTSHWKFAYTAGYTLPDDVSDYTLPEDVIMATLELVKTAYFNRTRNPFMREEEWGDSRYRVSETALRSGLPAETKQLLDPWRKLV